ncbi:MAG: Gfo/Idh/MocA family oxidoreductase [Actinobacteria bacterium]|nr:Gfo/Idh/MocA family oxidoreductase [Actinomycetota bacterium]
MLPVSNPDNIKLAMVGMVEGNGHPYSWSAIINGQYDANVMADCGFPVIPQYLAAAKDGLGISGAKVTHVWCDEKSDAEKVAKAAYIPTVVDNPQDVIGKVDAVIIATDKGWEHLDRARAFIEADIPIFIDKPLTDTEDHLQQFVKWQQEGKSIMSTSAMRYAKEFAEARKRLPELGQLRLITMTTPKTWERYGIHALEGVYPFLEPGGWLWVVNTGTEQANIVHCRHESGVDVILAAIADMYGAFACLNLYGTKGNLSVQSKDTFYAFRGQLVEFINYLRTGDLPFEFSQTVELMKIIIAGVRSRGESGRVVQLQEIKA